MKQNIGDGDRVIRVVLGTFLLFAGYCSTYGFTQLVVYLISTVMIAGGFVGYSFLYEKMGIRTKRDEGKIDKRGKRKTSLSL